MVSILLVQLTGIIWFIVPSLVLSLTMCVVQTFGLAALGAGLKVTVSDEEYTEQSNQNQFRYLVGGAYTLTAIAMGVWGYGFISGFLFANAVYYITTLVGVSLDVRGKSERKNDEE